MDNRGHDPHEVAQALAGYCRDLAVVLGTEGQAEALLDYAPSERADITQSQAKSLELSTTQRWFKIILDSSQDIAQASWPLWALEMAVLRLVEVESARSVTSLLERLATLAEGARSRHPKERRCQRRGWQILKSLTRVVNTMLSSHWRKGRLRNPQLL